MRDDPAMHDDAGNTEAQHYGASYLEWKHWGSGFGTTAKPVSAYFSAEIARTGQRFAQGSKVLEIGFGNGAFLNFAVQNGWRTCGTEINPALVKLAQQRGFDAVPASELSNFEDNSFALVVAFDVLEHIEQDRLPGLFAQVRRVLDDGGFFIARFPNGDSPFGLKNQNGDITHKTAIGSEKARHFASQAGLAAVFIGAQAQPVLGAGWLRLIHGTLAVPLKKAIDLLVSLIFYPGHHVAFSAQNLTAIYRADKAGSPGSPPA